MTVSSRPATATDATDVADVLIASRAAFLPHAPLPHTDEAVRAWVRNALPPSGGVTVAVIGDQVMGVLAVRRADEILWIDQLYLRPSHMGRGIGAFLLTPVLAAARGPVRLFAFQRNTGGRRFHERHGFVAIRFYDGSGNEERCPDVLYKRAAGGA